MCVFNYNYMCCYQNFFMSDICGGSILLKKFGQISHYYIIINYDVLLLSHMSKHFSII